MKGLGIKNLFWISLFLIISSGEIKKISQNAFFESSLEYYGRIEKFE
jgi:hypothetical protein